MRDTRGLLRHAIILWPLTAWHFQQSRTDGHPVNVKAVMDTWTLQMNYPLVTVTVKNGMVNVKQSRFLKNKDAQDPGKYQSPYK